VCVRIRYIGLCLALALVLWWVVLVTIASARGRNLFKCPNCESTRIRRSWPRVADKILFPPYIRPYRCEACNKRFHAMKRVNEMKSKKAAGGSIH